MAAWGDWEIFFLSILVAAAEIASWWSGAGLQWAASSAADRVARAPVPVLAGLPAMQILCLLLGYSQLDG